MKVDGCTNNSSAAYLAAHCGTLTVGTWTGLTFQGCIDELYPFPWLDEAIMEPRVSARNGDATTTFDGWQPPGGSVFCLGFFDTGAYGEKLGTEWKNFGLFTINGSSGGWGARREREVECPEGSYQSGNDCVRREIQDPYKANKHCPKNGTDPINTFNGERLHSETDYIGSGPDPLIFRRHYHSQSSIRPNPWEESSFGKFWRHTYSRSIQYFDNGTDTYATIFLENGDRYYYEEVDVNGEMIWLPLDPDVVGQLSLSTTGPTWVWSYTNENGVIEEYDFTTGRLMALTDHDGFRTTVLYDSSGRIGEVVNAFGRSLIFEYHTSGPGIGHISKMVVQNGGVPISGAEYRYEYEISSAGSESYLMIDKVYYPDDTPANDSDNPYKDYLYAEPAHLYEDLQADIEAGPSTQSFNAPEALTGIIDENGARYATFKYKVYLFAGGNRRGLAAGGGFGEVDANGKYAEQHTVTRYDSDAFRLDSDSHNGYTSIKDANDVVRNHHYAYYHYSLRPVLISGGACNFCGQDSQSFTYDSNTGFETSRTDHEENLTILKHDDYSGLEVCRIEGVSATDPLKNTPRRTIRVWDHEARVNLEQTVYEPTLGGSPDLNECDPTDHSGWVKRRRVVRAYVPGTRNLNLMTEYSYDSGGVMDETPRATSYTYYGSGDPNGNEGQLKTIDGPRTDVSDVTQHFYATSASSTHNIGDLTEIWDPKGHKTEFLAFDAHGRVIEFRDINSQRHYLTYDARGNLTKQQIGNYDTRYEYDNVGNLTKVILPDDSYTIFRYDAAHRLYEMVDNFGNKIVYTLDAMGNRVTEVVLDPSDTMVRTLTRVYDNLNRLQKSIDGVGNETIFTYDANGNLDTTTNPKSYVTDNYYDALDRVNQVVDALSNSTFMEFDVLDHVVTVTDPRGNPTTYTHNGFGDLMQLNSPDSGQSVYEYDSAGNRISSTDARGIQIGYQYDELNRLTYIDYPTDIDTQLIYDTGSAWQFGRKGRLATMIDESGTMDFRYDFRGNAKEVITVRNGIEHTMWYDHDNAERIKTIVYPSGRRIDYGRDAVGNINKITQTFAGETTVLMSDANYEPFGPLGYIEFGSTVDTSSVALHHRTAIDYDLTGRIYRQRRDIVANGVPSPLNSPEYQYDANSNIAHIADLYSTTLAPDSFEYDELDQLEVWTRGSDTPYTLKFEYDANGNRTKKLDGKWGWHQVLNIEPGSNRILEEVMQGITPEYHYDANGNELGIDAIPGISLVGYPNMEYGENNRLRRVLTHTGNSELASHLYNGLGQRTKKAGLSGAVYYYHYDVEGNLIAETDNFGDTIVEYIYLNQQPFAIVVDAESGIGTTPTFVSDPDGNGLVWRRWNNPNASGNQALLSPPETKADPLTGSRANYSVTVANAGTYTLYVRGKGSDSTAATVYVTDSITGQVDDLSFATSSWQFKWRTHSIPISANANQTFDVTLIRRNRDTEVDVFVLSTDSQLSSSELDDLVGLAGSPSTLADTYTWEAEGTTPWVADAGDVYFYHNDHLGTPKLITDHSGTEVWRADNEPFRPRPAYPWAIDSNLVYPGQYYDTEGGISYNGFRHYSSRLGRYVQSDPTGLDGGLNTYVYANNNPLRYIDPLGLKARVCCKGIGGFGIGALAGANHCYIEVQNSSRITWGLFGDTRGPRSRYGVVSRNDGFDNGGSCGAWVDDGCKTDTCVDNAARAYPNPSVYRFASGPNSNTFAGTIARACGLSRPFGRPAPGWNDPPAAPVSPPVSQ